MPGLRKFMRGVLLPVEEMKTAIRRYLGEYGKSIDMPVLDFGSGTLLWSEWFQEAFNAEVLAFDIAYKNEKLLNKIRSENRKISYSYDFNDMKDKKFSIIFACDVLHHVGRQALSGLLEDFSKMSDFIVIKDIEAEDKIGNLQNKIHDFLINGERVCDIYSAELLKFFEGKDYKVYRSIHKKLGYPHFLLIVFKKP